MSGGRSPLDILIDKAVGREPEPPLDVLHCPFCGGNVISKVEVGHPQAKVMLMCMSSSECSASLFGMSLEDCIRQWNRRA
jgi:hypothetical protein